MSSFQGFPPSDFSTPDPSPSTTPCPDEMMPLLSKQQLKEVQPNLDIILSKLLNNDELNDIEIQQLCEQDRYVVNQVQERVKSTKKRPDEYQKLFYKRAFKYAEKEYFGRSKNKSRKMSGFYHHHFGKIAKQMNVPIVNFYHPDKKTKPGLRVGQKSFNKSFIKLLLRSETFRQTSQTYCLRFRQDCIDERRVKIPKFVTYLKNLVMKYGHDFDRMAEVIRSSKCKVPWTREEIEEAGRRARMELDHYSSTCHEAEPDEHATGDSQDSSMSEE